DEPLKYFLSGLAGYGVNDSNKASNLPNKNFLRQIQKTAFYQTLDDLYQCLAKKKTLLNNLQISALTYQLFYHLIKDFPNHPPVRKTPKNDQYQIAINYITQKSTDTTCT